MGKNPNVLYIITHDQGIAANCYASEHARMIPKGIPALPTPNIDKIAASGTKLTNHFCTFPMCCPARASLLTGVYPQQHGLIGLTHRGFSMHSTQKTVIHHFAQQGYTTMLIGLQHESNNPKKLGYQKFIRTPFHFGYQNMLKQINKNLLQLQKAKKPWWVTIGVEMLHRPWVTKAKAVDMNSIQPPEYLPNTIETQKETAEFVGVLKSYDDFIGKLVSIVQKLQLEENTYIIITTDHGIAFPRAKGTLYDPGLQTLMIWKRPGVIASNQDSDLLLSQIDFAPTISELCELPRPDWIQGVSYAKYLKEKAANPNSKTQIHESIFAEKTFADIYDPMRCIRTDRFKYIRNYSQNPISASPPRDIRMGGMYKAWVASLKSNTRPKEEFYDLQTDRLEQKNLIDMTPDNVLFPILQSLRSQLDDWLVKMNDPIRFGEYPAPKKAKIDKY